MKTFDLKSWMSENREVVISKYENLKNEKFYNGVPLKTFMTEILNLMTIQNIKSEARAAKMLPILMGNVYFNHSKIDSRDFYTEKLKNKYDGTAYMAMV